MIFEDFDGDLGVLEGEIPRELEGHTFMIGPGGLTHGKGREPILQGDGMVYRVDWAKRRMKARRIVTPCLLAETAAARTLGLEGLRFMSAGIVRFSPRLGVRNFANTALLPFDFGGSDGARLLATYDGGRPIELDPVSLECVTPVGATDEWSAFMFEDRAFPAMLSTAHPVADAKTKELFSVCWARSFFGVGKNFLEVVRWDGSGKLERWRVLGASIQQTVHQIAVTKNYVVIMDTGMKVSPGQMIDDAMLPGRAGKLMRNRLSSPQATNTPLWIIRRDALIKGRSAVAAVRAELPYESVHFVADEPPDGLLHIHAGHNVAMDVAEWIRPYDVEHFSGKPVLPELIGAPCVAPMDVSRTGSYVIAPETGAVTRAETHYSERDGWGIALYATKGEFTLEDSTPSDRVVWSTTGFSPRLLTRFIYDLYKRSSRRTTPLSTIARFGARGRPACLLGVDRNTAKIEDAYAIGYESAAGGIQYAPPGYITAAINTATNSELHIYDAHDLARGPICRLATPRMGLTLHAAWLPELAPRRAAYLIDAREDLGPRIRGDRRLEDLFERNVYPRRRAA